MNCYIRKVEFEKENREKIIFVGKNRKIPIRIISVMKVMRKTKYLKDKKEINK